MKKTKDVYFVTDMFMDQQNKMEAEGKDIYQQIVDLGGMKKKSAEIIRIKERLFSLTKKFSEIIDIDRRYYRECNLIEEMGKQIDEAEIEISRIISDAKELKKSIAEILHE